MTMTMEKLTHLRDTLLDAAVAISEKLAGAPKQPQDLAVALDATMRALDAAARYVEQARQAAGPYQVVLAEMPPPQAKIQVIKAIRACADICLKDAKDMTEAFRPVIKSGLSKEQAEAVAREIRNAGGHTEVVEREIK